MNRRSGNPSRAAVLTLPSDYDVAASTDPNGVEGKRTREVDIKR